MSRVVRLPSGCSLSGGTSGADLRVLAFRSGCSTLLKTIAGETHGLFVDEDSYINYQGELDRDSHIVLVDSLSWLDDITHSQVSVPRR